MFRSASSSGCWLQSSAALAATTVPGAPSPLRFPTRRDRDRITNLQRLFSLAVELPEVRRHIRKLIDRPPVPFLDHLFKGRHDWAMQRTFYRAFKAATPAEVGRQEMLEQAERDLDLR